MKMQKAIAMLLTAVFVIGMASFALAGEKMPDSPAVRGTVTMISGNNVTVQDAAGTLTTVTVTDAQGVKAGDMVEIQGDKVKVQKLSKP